MSILRCDHLELPVVGGKFYVSVYTQYNAIQRLSSVVSKSFLIYSLTKASRMH